MEREKGVHGCRYKRNYNYFDDYDRLCMQVDEWLCAQVGCWVFVTDALKPSDVVI
jgi:hypothetical protein